MAFGKQGAQLFGLGAGRGSGIPGLPAQTFQLGAYSNNLTSSETWLGAPFDYQLGFIRNSSWANMRTDASNAAAASYTRPQYWAVALTPGLTATPVTTLANVGAGSNDADITYIAQQLLLTQAGGTIWIRPGWEMNGNFYPWTQGGTTQSQLDYVAAFQKWVTLFRAVSSRFKFSFCVNLGSTNGTDHLDPTLAYPGDSYVDAIEGDVYFDIGSTSSASALWGFYKAASAGLDWLVAYAATHSKPCGIVETGINSDTYSPIIDNLAAYAVSSSLARISYWESNDNFSAKLSANQYPNSATAFIADFGKPVITSASSATGDISGTFTQVLTASKAVTWQIVGGANKSKFSISGSNLQIIGPAVGTYVVQVRAVDSRDQYVLQTFTATIVAAYVFTNTEASAYVARMGVQPNYTRKGLIDTFIGSLKSGSVYSALDTLHIFAAHDGTAGLLNVIGASNTATGANSPTFTTDRGYTGSGTAYVTLNRPANTAGSYGTNAGHLSCWELTNLANDTASCGHGSAQICSRDSTSHFQGLVNSFTNNTGIASASGNGHWIANRTTSAAQQYYKNGASIGSDTNASNNAPGAGSWVACTANTSFPAARQIAIMTTGGSLDATKSAALYNACQTYLHAIGAV